jgi:hypothetical protein
LHRIHQHAHATTNFELRLKKHSDRLEELLKRNPDEAELTMFQKSTYWAVIFGLIAVLCIDFLLLRATADWFISLGFYNIPWWLNIILTAFVPLSVLLLELVTAEQQMNAREESPAGGGAGGSFPFWTFFSLLLVIVIPAFSVATYWAKVNAELDPNEALPIHYKLQMVGLLCLSLVVHASVVYGGSLSRNARSFLGYFFAQRWLNIKIKRAQRDINRESEATGRYYRDYADAIEAHNNRYPEPRVLGGPFEKRAVKVINELYPNAIQTPPQGQQDAPGVEANREANAQGPDGAGANGNHAQTQTASPPQNQQDQEPFGNNNGQGGGEDEYYRTIVEGQIRNAEGEVTA